MTVRQLIQLLRDRSVEWGAFRLASGRTSPYYIDARRATMSAAGLDLIGRLGLTVIRAESWEPRAVGGLTLGADPVAYAIAAASRHAPPAIDAFTVRKAPKEHGQGGQIEGCFEAAMPVVIVEDVITSGGSALAAVHAVRDAGGDVLGVLAVVDRQEGGRAMLEGAGLTVRALVTAEDLGIPPDVGAQP